MKLKLRNGLNWDEQKLAIQTALVMGFSSENATFPVTTTKEGLALPSTIKDLAGLLEAFTKTTDLPADYVAASDTPGSLLDFDWRRKRGLESLFSLGDFLKDENKDLLPDYLNFKFVLPKETDLAILRAACNFSFRFGMETTKIEDFLITDHYTSGNAIIFSKDSKCSMKLEEGKEGYIIRVSGEGEELLAFSSSICEKFPLLSGFDTWVRALQRMTDSFAMKNLDGQLAYLSSVEEQKGVEAYFSPNVIENQELLEMTFPEVTFKSYKGMKEVYQKEYDLPWEVDAFKDKMKTIYQKVRPEDYVEIRAALSEEIEVRSELMKELKEELDKSGVKDADIKILCSYKQGFSWIEEEVLPKLQDAETIEEFTIAFKPFLQPGVTDWGDEGGATPSYNNLDANDPERWYDLPIRYLQELYPVADLIAEKLKIAKDKVHFVRYDGEQDLTYEVKVKGAGEKFLYQGSYQAAYSERPYLDAYQGMGKVHPATGYVRVSINGKLVLDERIASDAESVWEIYQAEILPDCRSFIEEKTKGNLTIEQQPFFSRLKIEATLSEPDYLLASRNDMISVLDGLHEDIYFVGADYFKNYGMEKCGKMLEEPGLILPVIKKGSGKPYLRVTLYDQLANKPQIIKEEKPLVHPAKREEISVYLKEVARRYDKLELTVMVEGVKDSVVEAYTQLLDDGIAMRDTNFQEIDRIHLTTKSNTYTAGLHENQEIKKDLRIEDIHLYENEVIGYEEYLEVMEQLKRVKGLNVYQTAESYLGRKLYAVELMPDYEGYVSRTKRITNHVSEIINCRHHANEVSSTNAAFMLLKTLLTDPTYQDVARELNLVIVPMENVDGSAIHYELQKDNPHWKLHVARFNAVGKEFYHEHFKAETKHTEAMGLTRLFETFVPDIIVDNHGVPSHEWEQQFSGYTSPSYKGFWLPRSLLYGYFWYVTNEEYKSNYPVNKEMEDIIADAIAKKPEMKKWNEEWANQFETYAHLWMPKLFPADYYKEMINYWIPFAYDAAHRYPSIRFPWITTVAYTSEVADETAQGDYLNLCARAHVEHDLATIDMLRKARLVYENETIIEEEKLKISHTRKRPIIVNKN